MRCDAMQREKKKAVHFFLSIQTEGTWENKKIKYRLIICCVYDAHASMQCVSEWMGGWVDEWMCGCVDMSLDWYG